MLSRIFFRSITRGGAQDTVFPSLRVGRMAPETTMDTIAQELQVELQEKGLVQLGKTLEEEKIILQELQATQKESLQRIKELCVTPAQTRHADGYNITGLFWQQKQQEMRQIATKETLDTREETIDWLKTRQHLYKGLKETHDKTPESFSETSSFSL